MIEITQRAIVPSTVDDLFAQADELFEVLLQGDLDEESFPLAIQKTSSGPLGLGTTFRVVVRNIGSSLGVDLCCTEYVPPQYVVVQNTDILPLKITLTFQPHQDNGTLLTARLDYEPPAGLMGMMLQALAPPAKIEERMRRGLETLQRHVETADGTR